MKKVSLSTASGLLYIPMASFEIKTLQDEKMESLPHAHNCFQVIWITRGSGTNYIDMNEHFIMDNQIFCIKPGQIHYFCPDADVKGFSFFFTESFINTGKMEFDMNYDTRFFQLLSKLNGSVINPEIVDELTEIAQKIQREMSCPYQFRNEILKRYLNIFLIYLDYHFEQNQVAIVQTRNEDMVQRFIRLVDRHFKEKKMVADYAGELCVTPNYLNEVIKKSTGYSAGYHIRQRIILEAKRLVLYSSISMKEIAYELGFLDTAHFSKFFKAVTGNNFSQFKREKPSMNMAV